MITRRGILAVLLGVPLARLVPGWVAPASPPLLLDAETWATAPGPAITFPILWSRTSLEIESGVWPYDPAYPPGHPLRYAV